MHYFTKPLDAVNLYAVHNQITYFIVFFWLLICFLGYYIKNEGLKKKVTIFLISISLIQEVFDYINKKLTNLGYTIKVTKDPSLKGTNLINLFAKK